MLTRKVKTLGILMHDVAHLLRTRIDRRVEPYNLTRVKWLALGALSRQNGMTQTELATYLELDKSTVGRLIDRLEERGFVRREKDPKDRRIFRIFIAETAFPVLRELEEVAEDVRAQALSGISKEDRQKLYTLLEQIKMNLVSARNDS